MIKLKNNNTSIIKNVKKILCHCLFDKKIILAITLFN